MKKANLRATVSSITKSKRIAGTIIWSARGRAAVKINGSSQVLHDLPVTGTGVIVGQQVFIDYTTGKPVVNSYDNYAITSGSNIINSSTQSTQITQTSKREIVLDDENPETSLYHRHDLDQLGIPTDGFEEYDDSGTGDQEWTGGTSVFWAISGGSWVQLPVIPEVPTLDYGTYTPVITSGSNIESTTAYSLAWYQIGSNITVYGRIGINPVTVGDLTTIYMELPVSSAFTGQGQLAGVATRDDGQVSCSISADIASGKALFSYYPGTTSFKIFYFQFSYRVL